MSDDLEVVVDAEVVLSARPHDHELDQLEATLGQLPQAELPLVHRFADGLYAREIIIPAGTLAMSKIHKTSTLSIVSAGRIAVWSDEGGARTIEAPYTFVGKPGTRFIGYAFEDTVWTCVHGTHETDLEKLEEELIEPRDVSPDLALAALRQTALDGGR